MRSSSRTPVNAHQCTQSYRGGMVPVWDHERNPDNAGESIFTIYVSPLVTGNQYLYGLVGDKGRASAHTCMHKHLEGISRNPWELRFYWSLPPPSANHEPWMSLTPAQSQTTPAQSQTRASSTPTLIPMEYCLHMGSLRLPLLQISDESRGANLTGTLPP